MVSVVVQGSWLTDLTVGQRFQMGNQWNADGSLTILAEDIVEVTLAGTPPIAIDDNSLLENIALGPVASASEAASLINITGSTNGIWLQQAIDTGLIPD